MIGADAIRGHIDLIVLSVLEAGPSYAYEIANTIGERAGGEYVVKQTTLYSAVKRLEGQGMLRSYPGVSASGKGRTYYRLTDAGEAELHAKRVEWAAIRDLIDRFMPDDRPTSSGPTP